MSHADSDEDPLLLHSPAPKRRRVRDVSSPEVIESSDADEREEEAALKPGYWEAVRREVYQRIDHQKLLFDSVGASQVR